MGSEAQLRPLAIIVHLCTLCECSESRCIASKKTLRGKYIARAWRKIDIEKLNESGTITESGLIDAGVVSTIFIIMGVIIVIFATYFFWRDYRIGWSSLLGSRLFFNFIVTATVGVVQIAVGIIIRLFW